MTDKLNTENSEAKKKESIILKPTLMLGMVALIAAFLLSHVYKNASVVIAKRAEQKLNESVSMVLPGYGSIESKTAGSSGGEMRYWSGVKSIDGRESPGYAFLCSIPGYSGNIETLAGVDENFTVLGIVIMRQTETPGLGARSVEVKSVRTLMGAITGKQKVGVESKTPWFQEQFAGLSLNSKIGLVKRGDWSTEMREELLSKNSISVITGATITSKAVVDSIERQAAGLKKALSPPQEKNAPLEEK